MNKPDNKTSFYAEDELLQLGLARIGKNVLISRKASIYGAQNISIGDNVRVDDFVILSGKITLKSNIHIASYCALYGDSYGIIMGNYSGLSARVTIYAGTDDFGGEYMVGAMVDSNYRHVIRGEVTIKDYVQVGAHCVVMPALVIEEGAAIGAMSFVNKDLEAWKIYTGIPARILKDRSKNLLNYTSCDE